MYFVVVDVHVVALSFDVVDVRVVANVGGDVVGDVVDGVDDVLLFLMLTF